MWLKREALYRAACEPFQQLALRGAFAGQACDLRMVASMACLMLLRRHTPTAMMDFDPDARHAPLTPWNEVQKAMAMRVKMPFMAVLAFALYALAVEGHAGADDARAALAGLRARYGDDCDVRSVWDECLQWSFGPDPTDGWWRMERMRLYCLVAGYYLGLLEGEERDRYLERTPFRQCGSDGVLLSRAFQQLEFAMPVAPDTPGCSGL